MPVQTLAAGLHRLGGPVNMYLIEAPEGLTLIDAGFPGDEARVAEALAGLGRGLADLRHIVLTHAHFDHIGALAALVRASGARTWLHVADVEIAERGSGFRPMTPAPGLIAGLIYRRFARGDRVVEGARIDERLTDGDVIPLAGGLQVVHAPGHCAGQCAFLWRDRGVAFLGDVGMNVVGIGPPIGYEDRAAGEDSQRRVAALDFDVAAFGHGPPILKDAARRLRRKWR